MASFQTNRNLLLIVSGPAGSGKTTLCTRMCSAYENVQRVITSTTREPREGEQNRIDYYFFDEATFKQKIEEDAFYEYAKVHNRYYGTLKSEIHEKLAKNKDVLLNIDVQGADSLRISAAKDHRLARQLVTVFVGAPNPEELQRRLSHRGQDSEEEIQRRLSTAKREMHLWPDYDYYIESGSRDHDFQKLSAIYEAEKLRVYTQD